MEKTVTPYRLLKLYYEIDALSSPEPKVLSMLNLGLNLYNLYFLVILGKVLMKAHWFCSNYTPKFSSNII
jgi:hypothetical protein